MAYNYFADELGTEVVTLVVGRDSQRRQFVVHKQLLVSQSNFFKSALTTSLFKEAVEGVMTFEEDDPDAFRLLVGWVYRGHVPRVQPFVSKPDFSVSTEKKAKGSTVARPRTPPLSRKGADETAELPDPDGGAQDKVIARHISAHKPFCDFSPEEIRLADYRAAAARLSDPLRRDAGVSSEPPKVKKRQARIRQEWLDRDTAGKIAVSGTTKAPDLNAQMKDRAGEGAGDPAAGQVREAVGSGSSSLARSSSHGAPATCADTAEIADEGPDDQSFEISHVPQCSEFTFRMERPARDDSERDAILPRKGPLTCAAVAALAASKDSIATLSSPLPGVGIAPRSSTPPSGSPAQLKAEKNAVGIFPTEPVPPRTAELWAERIKETAEDKDMEPPVGSVEARQEANDDDSEGRQPEAEPRVAGIAEVRWMNWTRSPNDAAFRSLEHASKEGEAHQMALVRLIALAEKLCWDRLFNDAMDAYLDGERLMRRQLVCLAHLEVAYTQCCPTSPLRRLLCDMVHFEARTNLTHSRYLEFAETHDDFLADLFKRLDLRAMVPGKHPFEQLRNPLNLRKCNYHTHVEWSGQFCL